MSIICSDDNDDKSYCNACGYILYEKANGSKVCSGCEKIYDEQDITKHKSELQPAVSKTSQQGPEVISMSEYGSYAKKKKASVFDREDRMMEANKSGFNFTSHEDIL